VTTTLPVPRCLYGLHILPWVTALAAALALGCSVPAQPPIALRGGAPFEIPAPAGPAPLEKNVLREEGIAAGETLEYPLSMAAGDYARVKVNQAKADVAVRLFDPSGQPVAAADGPGGRKAPELLSWIAGTGGDYRLEIAGKEAGRTQVTLEDLRPSKPGDAERVEAERDWWEAKHWSLQDEAWKRKALARFEEALALWQKSGDRPGEVQTLNEIGLIHRILGDTDEAISIFERALALALQAGDRRGEAQARNDLGVAHHQQGRYGQALDDLQSARRIWEELSDSGELANTLYGLGVVQSANGDAEEALASLARALEIRQAAEDPTNQSSILTAIAAIHGERGEGDTALELYRRALDLSRSAGDRNDEAYALQNMASLYMRRGEQQQSLELFTAALQIHRELGNRPMEAWLLSSLGTTSLYLGDYDRALDYYTQALKIHTETRNAWQACTLQSIGRVYDLQGHPETALEYYSQAYQSSHGSDPRCEALALHGTGQAKITQGNPREAMQFLEQALALYRGLGNIYGEASALLDLGRAWQALSDEAQASRLFHEALDLCRQRKILNTEAVVQSAIARLERDRGHLAEAASAIEDSLRIIESMRPKVASQRQRVTFFASRREYYDFYVDLQMRMREQDPAGDHLAVALATSERARARGLLDLLAEGRIDLQRGISPELKTRADEIGNRVSLLQGQLLDDLAQGGKRAARIEAELDTAEDEREQVEWQIRREHPHYAAMSNPAILEPQRIQELLDDRTALLEYAVGSESSYLFVVTRDRLEGYRLPAAGELAEQVEVFREALEKGGRRQFSRYTDSAHQLYQALLGPAEEILRDKPRLIVSPDGPLLLLSFEALLTRPVPSLRTYADLPYLLAEKSVTYVPSASVFAELGGGPLSGAVPVASKAGSGLFLGFADPDYGQTLPVDPAKPAAGTLAQAFQSAGLTSPRSLPSSRIEVQEIARLFPSDHARLYLGSDASEANVKENPALKEARWIHFAVHGFFNEERPELSGLILAQGGERMEVGLLQAYEIFNLDLTADLVVLSACDTALGKNVSGEGILGVSRAFLYAGASSVIVSLWQVSDASTSDLMIRFYRHLSQSGDKAEALRLSKLELIRQGRFDQPYRWAPFILIGRPGGAVTSRRVARQ
jgi:CHAT domain-containing protein/Tfp pilus assembly protein PilF